MSDAKWMRLLGGGLVFAGLLFAMPSMYVPGVALLALGAGTAGWVRYSAREAGIEQALRRATVVEGERATTAVRATPGRWPSPGGLLHAGASVVRVAPGSREPVEATLEQPLERRGRHRLAPARLVLADPLGLAKRTLESRPPEVLVLPRTEPVRRLRTEGSGGRAARAARSIADETELDSLRPYRPGAPASRIHWPAAARLGELIERRMVADSDTTPLIVLDSTAPDDEESLDKAVRATGSLCLAMAGPAGCRVLLPDDPRPAYVDGDLRAWPALWARLAIVDAVTSGPHGRIPRGVTTLFWVTGRRQAPASLPGDAAAERFLVSPGAYEPGRTAFTVAGCRGRRLRSLGARAA